jgi:hypothetical protein
MRAVASLAIATGISPLDLVEAGPDWIATLIDVVNERK